MILSMLDMYFQEIEKNKVTDADKHGEDNSDNNSDATITRINSEDDLNKMRKNLRTSALLLLEQILTDNKLEPLKDC
jgi:hypothetical protein